MDHAPAALLDRTLRSDGADSALLAKPTVESEDDLLDEIDQLDDDDGTSGEPGDA